MRRRDFLATTGLAAMVLPEVLRADNRPCPPAELKASGGRTIATACGPSAVGAAPKWFVDMPERAWVEVAAGAERADIPAERRGQRLNDVRVVPDAGTSVGLKGNGWSPTVPWTGGAVDPTRRELILAANGGHGDGVDNGVYICRIGAETPRWYRAVDPTPDSFLVGHVDPPPRNSLGVYGDGRPRSVHGWHKQCFGNGRVWYVGQESMATRGSSTAIVSWNRDYAGDDPEAWPITHPSTRGVSPASDLGGWQYHGQYSQVTADGIWFGPACYDPVGQKVWTVSDYTNSPRYWSVSAATNAALLQTPAPGTDSALSTQYSAALGSTRFGFMWSACAYDANGVDQPGVVVVAAAGTHTVYVLDLRKPDAGFVAHETSPQLDWDLVGATSTTSGFATRYGAVYHAPSRSILVYDPSLGLGAKIRALRIPDNPVTGSYRWDTIAEGSGSVAPAYPSDFRGAFSKFNIVPDMGNGQAALVLVTDVKGPVYVYKLPANGV